MTENNTGLMARPNAVLGVNMRELEAAADLIFKSHVFGDIQSKEAAAIKVVSGLEYGFTPFQSMSMFDFIQGRPTLNAHGKATLINSSGDFRLKINELTPRNCSISVVRKSDGGEWKVISTETFTIEDAKLAELTNGKNAHSWRKYPRNMLFARCVSNIWRWHTAELNMRKFIPGQIQEFEADELEADGPADTVVEGEVVDAEYVDPVADEVEAVDLSTGEVIEVEQVANDYTGPEVTADEPPDPDPEPIDPEESKLVDLREYVMEMFNGLSVSRRKDVQAGKTPISAANYDELLDYKDLLEKEAA